MAWLTRVTRRISTGQHAAREGVGRDLVFQVNRHRVTTADALRQAFTAAAGNQAIIVWFERGGMIARSAFYVR
jgi:hypothetical protein